MSRSISPLLILFVDPFDFPEPVIIPYPVPVAFTFILPPDTTLDSPTVVFIPYAVDALIVKSPPVIVVIDF